MADVFISYSRADTDFVRSLHASLEKEGREAWVDWQDIAPSALWMDEIRVAIEASDTFVFVISPDSVGSTVCAEELAHAVAQQKRLIPVVRRDTPTEAVPEVLRPLNWIFFRERDDFAAASATLLRAIDTDLAWVKAHTRLLTRGLEWERRGRRGSLLLRGDDLRAAEELLADVGPERSPQPTPGQRAYLLASRRGATRTLRTVLGIGAGVVAALALLAVVALVQRRTAEQQRNRAEEQTEIAEERRAEAERQANVALSRQLAAQAQSIVEQQPGAVGLAAALAIESMRRYPSVEADEALRRAGALLPQLALAGVHDRDVTDAVFSGDEKYLVTGSRDGNVRVYDVAGKRELHRLPYDTPVGRVAISPNGTYIAAASDLLSQVHTSASGDIGLTIIVPPEYATTIWETVSGRVVARLPQTHLVGLVRFSPTSETLATATIPPVGTPGSVALWESETGRQRARFELAGSNHIWDIYATPTGGGALAATSEGAGMGGLHFLDVAGGRQTSISHPKPVRTIAVAPEDGRYIATGDEEGTVRLYEPRVGNQVVATMRMGGAVTALAFKTAATGRLLAAGDALGSARVWEAPAGIERLRVQHEGEVKGIDFREFGRQLIAVSLRSARLWDVASGEELARFAHGGASVNAVTVGRAENGRLLATAGADGTVRIWEIERSGGLRGRVRFGEMVFGVAVSPDGATVVVGGSPRVVSVRDGATLAFKRNLTVEFLANQVQFSPDGTRLASVHLNAVRLWRTDTWAPVATIQGGGLNPQHVAFSADGALLAAASLDKSARLYDARGRELRRLAHDDAVHHVAFSPDGARLLTASSDTTVRVWDSATGAELLRLTHDHAVRDAWFSADGTRIVTRAGLGGYLWDATNGRQLRAVLHNAQVNAMALSADGRIAATGSGDAGGGERSARVWDAATGEVLHTFVYEQTVGRVAFSPDGTHLAVADSEHQVHVVELASGREVARARHDDTIVALLFTPDGRHIVSGGHDRTVRRWAWRAEDVIADLCDRGMRNLTAAEWSKYLGEEPRRATCADRPLP